MVLNHESKTDSVVFKKLVENADIVLDGMGVGVLSALDLGYEELGRINPGIIYCSITPFGAEGPWSSFAASDLTQLALGGVMALCGYDDGSAEEPIAPIGGQSKHVVGMMAVMATLAALVERDNTGVGQYIDISAHESLAVSTEMAVPFWLYQQREVKRQTARHAMPETTPRWQHLCADGKYLLALPLYITDARFAALVEWFESEGMAEDLADEKYRAAGSREEEMFHVVDVIGRFCDVHDSEYMFREAQARRLPWAPVNAPEELLQDSHFTEVRGTFVDIASPDGGQHKSARLPYLIGQDQQPHAAPQLGAHTDQILDQFTVNLS